jgi:hypothetical protein
LVYVFLLGFGGFLFFNLFMYFFSYWKSFWLIFISFFFWMVCFQVYIKKYKTHVRWCKGTLIWRFIFL